MGGVNCGRIRRGQGEAEGWGQVEGGRELGGVGRGGGWHQIFLEGARERGRTSGDRDGGMQEREGTMGGQVRDTVGGREVGDVCRGARQVPNSHVGCR